MQAPQVDPNAWQQPFIHISISRIGLVCLTVEDKGVATMQTLNVGSTVMKEIGDKTFEIRRLT